MKRHDYLPFGEELFAPAGGRTTAMGYASGDNVRQQFTSKERDVETGLDYFLARYYSSTQGRFTSPDEFTGGPDELYNFAEDAADNPTFYADINNPQSLNKYQYTYNNPVNMVDPDGHWPDLSGFVVPSPKVTIAIISNPLDSLQAAISVVGIVPGAGEAADIANAAISVARGNYADAALDLAGAAGPGGSVVAVGNRVRKIAKAANKLDEVATGASAAKGAGKNVHGNSLDSTKPQHGYEIADGTGDVKKVGVSSSTITNSGTSPRATSQVNRQNKTRTGSNRLQGRVAKRNVNSRRKILEWEKKQAGKRKQEGNSMELHKRP
jgi:RHS repeat-associated protein